ncbi:MAG: hypothetical protein HGA67_04045 [Candidatus Yonathbacteria bacterium]|nr:hypothetical protein [Candidatus Yonathbacteria bacterium]
MINLLPLKEKKQLLAMYRERVMIVGLFLASGMFILSSFVVGALLVSAKDERRTLEEAARLRSAAPTALESDTIERDVATINDALAVLAPKEGQKTGSVRNDLFEAVVRVRGAVTIGGLSYHTSHSGAVLDIQGTAPTRQELVAFSTRLERAGFVGARIPVSSFVEEKNIPFALSVPIQ